MKANGYILHESGLHVAIATGFRQKSKNPKTGNTIQVWILVKPVNPIEAVMMGQDREICLDCGLRGNLGRGRGCYVNLGRGPLPVWKKYMQGGYPVLAPDQYAGAFAGRFVRFGAYGEPVLLPWRIVKAIAEACAGWTGYTHQWRQPWMQAYKRYFMASTTEANREEAEKLGWRTFTVSERKLDGAMVCPASQEFEAVRGYKLSCIDCGQCAGLSRKGRSVQIQPHGQGRRYTIAA